MANQEVGTGYVTIKPKMDGKALSDVESSGKKSGSGFGGSFSVAAGNMIASAVTQIASAAVDVFSEAFGEFANFEQLTGGVEKIFNEADISGIMEDANNAYKDLNMSANEYLAAINQTGAAFAQTMGDQKGYDTARLGMKAIADYASGTGRNLDELNDKFAMITRATSSYQSIADQFSGILPATSADFLEQAQAAGLLSEEYTKLTDVPVAEYQEAVAKMLDKGVDAMGLAGNTFAESTETISGSLAMLTSSWQNFMVGLFNGDADVNALFDNVVESFMAVAKNVLPVLETVMERAFGEDFVGGIRQVITSVASTVERIMPKIMNVISTTMGIIGNIVKAVGDVFAVVWPAIEVYVTAALDVISNGINNLAWIVDFVAGIFSDVKDAIIGPIESARDMVLSIIDAIVGFFDGLGKRISDAIGQITLPGLSGTATVNGVEIAYADVTWAATGGFVDGATLIGAGERGGELIWPSYEPYLSQYADALASRMGGDIVVNLNYDASSSANDLARDFARTIREIRGARGLVYG